MTYTVFGSNGEFEIDETGKIITSPDQMPEEYSHLNGATADIAEHLAFWNEHYWNYTPADGIDILDLGFRLADGSYEAAESEWRADCVRMIRHQAAQNTPSMTDITSRNMEAAIIDQKVAGEFRGKRYAFAPVLAKGKKIGEFWMLGVAVENEAGYSPVEGRYFAEREEAREWADGLNQHIGHTPSSAFAIICSSVRKGLVRR